MTKEAQVKPNSAVDEKRKKLKQTTDDRIKKEKAFANSKREEQQVADELANAERDLQGEIDKEHYTSTEWRVTGGLIRTAGRDFTRGEILDVKKSGVDWKQIKRLADIGVIEKLE